MAEDPLSEAQIHVTEGERRVAEQIELIARMKADGESEQTIASSEVALVTLQQILELAMALITEPRILLLDEPCAGLSPEETAAVMAIIRWAAARLGGSIIIIEHDMSLVKELAQVVYVLHNGALLAKGSVAEIQADAAVRAVYVGSGK